MLPVELSPVSRKRTVSGPTTDGLVGRIDVEVDGLLCHVGLL